MSNEHLAYDEEHHALEAVMRLQSVKRWHMIDTTRQQTLAEHSANVAMLVLLIIRQLPLSVTLGPHSIDVGAVVAALVHDIGESFTGDIPTHTKKHLQGLDDLEDRVIPPEFYINVPPHVELLIKLCDLADGIRFIRLHGVDLTAKHARAGLEKQFERKFAAAETVWPLESARKIQKTLMFYAYENS